MTAENRAGLILCGGRSSRMGRPKHLLEIDDRTFLDHSLTAMVGIVNQLVVSIFGGQALIDLPAGVKVVEDRHAKGSGPLAGIAAAFQAIDAESMAVLSCDAPLIKPAVLQLLFDSLGAADAVYCSIDGRTQYFPGVYRRKTGEVADRLLSRGEHRMSALVAECDSRVILEDQIRAIDPDLDSFLNVNTPQDYDVLLQRLGRR